MREIVIIAHDIRSCHNVGALLRTADGFGVSKVYLTGYTPYPKLANDTRLPHVARRASQQIHKTALGAEERPDFWEHHKDVTTLIEGLRRDQYQIVALEQNTQSLPLPEFQPAERIAIVLGREVEGLDKALLERCDVIVEIPMLGQKESLNVTEAATAAIYHCRFWAQ